MARIRTIKPEFPQSESMGRVSRDARLTFIQLWTLADDEGKLRGNSRMLASLLFPYDDDAPKLMDVWLSELVSEDCIVLYKIGNDSYIQICKWLIHQKIDKPSKSKIPDFDDESRILANPRECSSEDQGSRIKEGTNKRVAALSCSALMEDGLTEETANEFLALRRKKGSPLTPRAWKGIQEQAAKAGWSNEDAVAKCLARGWTGFEAEWVQSGIRPASNDPKPKETPWWASDQSILKKAQEMGMSVRAGESWQDLRGRINQKLEAVA